MEMLSLSNVEKRFGTKQVLKNVTFSVPEHTIYPEYTVILKLTIGHGDICVTIRGN